MSSFFLIIYKSAKEDTGNIPNDALEEKSGDYSWINIGNRIRLAVETSRANNENDTVQDTYLIDEESGCIIISDSRIYYRQELAGKLGIKWDETQKYPDMKLLSLSYLKWGDACLHHLYGDFSFVIWDPRREEVFFARDHFGCRPLYYVDQTDFLALASHISAFKFLPGFRFEIREQYILDTICSIVAEEPLSAYKGINRLKPAHYLKQVRGQLSNQLPYWDLRQIEAVERLTLEEASNELRDRFIEAVRQRINTPGQIGIELSGGLDSSAIASILTILAGKNEKINAFTHSIASESRADPVDLNSELEFSRALVENDSSIRQFLITGDNSEGLYNVLIKALSCLVKPVNLHYAMNSDLLFEVAENEGINLIFSGLGGDEGITYNGKGYYNELIRLGQHSKLGDQIRSIASSQGKSFCWQLIKHYINYYTPWLSGFYKKDWRKVAYRSLAIQKNLGRKYRMKRRFISSNSFPDRADVRGIQHFRIKYPNIPERIEATFLFAQQYGIEYRYPFLDVRLLEFFYSLPSEYKFRDGMGRYLFRMAMEGIIPEKIRMRADKGGNTIPYVFERLLKDEELFRGIIDKSRSENQYHYLDYDKLHKILDSFKNTDMQPQREFGIREFQSAMGVLILQMWQREGKIDIGIKC